MFTPTQIGQLKGLSAKAVNQLLVVKKFQTFQHDDKGRISYTPTAKAAGLYVLEDTGKVRSSGAAIMQIKWLDGILDLI